MNMNVKEVNEHQMKNTKENILQVIITAYSYFYRGFVFVTKIFLQPLEIINK